MKVGDLEIQEQEFGETTKEPGLVRSEIIQFSALYFFRLLLWANLMVSWD